MRKVLTIAGSDSGGGAGIQADLKTFAANGVYGCSVITAVTSQNTVGVYNISPVPYSHVKSQLKAVLDDIEISSIKIGMVFNEEIVNAIYECLVEYNCDKIVLDPVMISTSMCKLLDDRCIDSLVSKLFKLSCIVTPNIEEAKVLSHINIQTIDDMKTACIKIKDLGPNSVLVKGGHLYGDKSTDVLYYNNEFYYFEGNKIDSQNTHGTGCTLSSAIAANLAKGYSLTDSVRHAKSYLTEAIRQSYSIGHGSGPVNHFFNMNKECPYHD